MSRKLIYLFGGVVLLMIVAAVVIIVLQRRASTTATNINSSNSIPNVNTVILQTNENSNSNVNTANTNQDARSEVQQLASSFASIYASFSSQNGYSNITDLYFYMTPALKENQQAYVAQQTSQAQDTSLYHGISSVARIVAVQDFDISKGTATAKVTLQRVETSGTNNSQTYNQDLTLGFERIQGAWKVGHITWGAKQ